MVEIPHIISIATTGQLKINGNNILSYNCIGINLKKCFSSPNDMICDAST